jgi:crotonobetainyl-CoA:carnitine CoA-transferase CaiB-like acyl-CoA transferase
VPGLLEGVRVLDLSIWRPGPYCTQLLAEMGADVVKVEPPGGDPMRVFAALFADLNVGKRSAAVDLKADEGRAAVLGLAAAADVVVEGFRPGVAARLGIGPDEVRAVNPGAVYCSISGYGQDGPLAQVPGHDVNYQSWAGVLEPGSGRAEPVLPRPPIADLAGGAYAALAICAALVRRGRTGEGEVVDVAMTDVLASWTGAVAPLTLPDGRVLGGRVAGYGIYATADGGWVSLGVLSEDHLWAALATAVGLDDVAALTFVERTERCEELEARLVEALRARPRDELVAALEPVGVPVAPVLSGPEVLEADTFRARGLVTDGRDGGPAMRHPLRYRDHPAELLADVPPLVEGADALPTWH